MYFYKLHIILFMVSVVASNDIPMFDELHLLSKISKILPPFPTFRDFAKNTGLHCEEYNVTTSDGYILQTFRIPGNVEKPLLMLHGLSTSGDSLIIREDESLVKKFARENYDIWVGNSRGNRYARSHVKLNPDKDESFWNFTLHEMGVLDLPATIDLVLETTGQSQLSAIGHSQGNTIFYIMGSKRPEYNKKIKVLAALGPVAYMHNMKGLLPVLLPLEPGLNAVEKAINYQEVLGHDADLSMLLRSVCAVLGYEICSNLVFTMLGFDQAQLEPEFFWRLVNNNPAGSSRKNVMHYYQIWKRKEFAEFDYGHEKNLELYGSASPPVYNLSKVTFDVALYYGANDFLATAADVSLLEAQLPRVVKSKLIDYPLWNHVDFVTGKFLPKYLVPLLIELLAEYNPIQDSPALQNASFVDSLF